jgi:diguanylate cyclase (GGDEF)-like protein
MLNKSDIIKFLKKAIKLLTFTDLPIRKKFVLFSVGSFFWFIVIAAIGLVSFFEMNSKSKYMVDVIVPQEKTANIIVRKLRGASISAHKAVIYKDPSIINAHYIRAKERLSDCRLYLDTLLTGGSIKDYSRGTGQFYEEFSVPKIYSDEGKKFVFMLKHKINALDSSLDHLFEQRLAPANKEGSLEDALLDYDVLTKDTVSILTEYSKNINNEWTKFSAIVKKRTGISILLMAGAFSMAAMLSGVFSAFISRALSRPIKIIIEQIKSLSAGEINLTRKLAVTSKDEIGVLSSEFNKLMDSISHVASFKKIIEEDESTDDIYLRLGRIFIDDLGFDNCVIYEVSDSKNSMKIVYPPEAEGTELHCKRDIQLDCDLCRAKRTGHDVTSADCPRICKYYVEGADDIHYCIPLIIGGNVGGVVQFVCGKRGVCDIADIERKMSRAKQYITEAQPVLEAKRLMKTLKESAFRDALTGLYNRRFLEESFENVAAGILRRGTVLGLMMCDLDFFKRTNDEYGHDVGDIILKETASIIRTAVRNSDIAIRFGGEEFLVMLMDIKPEEAVIIGEKIREKIEGTKVKITGGFIQKTISIGVSEFPTDTQNFWEAIKFADVALYKAKDFGRNKVVRFVSEMWSEESY